MRRILAFTLLAAAALGATATTGTASAQPFVMSPGQADRVTAGEVFDATGFATALARQGVVPYAALHVVSPEDGDRTEHNFWASAPTTTPRNALSAIVRPHSTDIIRVNPRPDSWEYGETLVARPSIAAFRHR